MDFLGIGPGELLVIVIIALIVFGPERLPEIGATLGRIVRDLRKASQGFTEELQRELPPLKEGQEAIRELKEARQELKKGLEEIPQEFRKELPEVSQPSNTGQGGQNDTAQRKPGVISERRKANDHPGTSDGTAR